MRLSQKTLWLIIFVGCLWGWRTVAAEPAAINRLTATEIKKSEVFNRSSAGNYVAPIFTFHHVSPVPPRANQVEKNLHILPGDFETMLIELGAYGYQPVFISELADRWQAGDKLPPTWLALTFDDGYEDFYTYVFPLLKTYHIKASLYVITGLSGGRYLTQDQIKEIDASGLVEIGSHTVSHPMLAKLSRAKQLNELRKSKQTLDVLLNKETTVICYPFGSYNKITQTLAKELGYKYGLTYNHRPHRLPTDPLAIDRLGVWPGMKVVDFLLNLNKKP